MTPVPRRCPHCDRLIEWQDYAGLATEAWHYEDSIISQAVVVPSGEPIDSPIMSPGQWCGHCKGVLTAETVKP